MKRWTIMLGLVEPESLAAPLRARADAASKVGGKSAKSDLRPTFTFAEQRWILAQLQTVSPVPEKVEFDAGDLRSPAHYRYFLAYFVVEADTEFAAQIMAGDLTTKCDVLFTDLALSVQRVTVSEGAHNW